MRLVLGFLCAMTVVALCADANETESPIYQRQRQGAWYGGGMHPGAAMSYAGGPHFPGHAHHGWNRYHRFQGGFIAGSWYARPYPYHFDYYRALYSGQPNQPNYAGCPCVKPEPEPSLVTPE